jgi:hypothetical protein
VQSPRWVQKDDTGRPETKETTATHLKPSYGHPDGFTRKKTLTGELAMLPRLMQER